MPHLRAYHVESQVMFGFILCHIKHHIISTIMSSNHPGMGGFFSDVYAASAASGMSIPGIVAHHGCFQWVHWHRITAGMMCTYRYNYSTLHMAHGS